MAYVTVDVDVYLTDFDTEDLIDELDSRGIVVGSHQTQASIVGELIRLIYEKRRLGMDYEAELDEMIYQSIGRAI